MPKCEICRDKFEPKFNSRQPTCMKVECLAEYGRRNADKYRTKNWIEFKKKTKEKHKTHSDYENLLQPLTNTIARLIDKGHNCISHKGKCVTADAGHYHSVGSSNNVRFNLFNTWVQCDSCNRRYSGNRTGYDEGLKELFGHELWLYINEGMRLEYSHVKLTIPELKECIIVAREIVKELKAADLTYTVQQRVDLRHEFNARIGIYK